MKRFLVMSAVVLGVAVGIAAFLLKDASPAHLFCRAVFELTLRRDKNEIEKQSRTGESDVYYFTSYYLHGLLSAVEATHSERLLKKALHYLDNMAATAIKIPTKHGELEVWGPFKAEPGTPQAKPNVHYTLQACVPLARAAAIIQRDPAFRTRYAAQAARYSAFVDSAVFAYWYRGEFHETIPWLANDHVLIWNDNTSNIALCATFLYQATGDERYGRVAREVGKAFQAKLSPSGNGWIWDSNAIPIGSDTDNTPGSVGNQAGVPDTSHTNREAMLMVFLHETALVFSVEDVNRMARTLTDNIWNGSMEEPSFANYINGADKPYRVYKEPGLNGPIYHGWALVGGYSADAQRVLFHALKAIVAGKKNPSLDRNRTGYGGVLALSGHLLRNQWLLEKAPAS